jgi:signal transduction histidine kinase
MLRDAGFAREREIPPDLPFVRGDADAVHQCVENLIGNAIKYGRAGNWISVRAGLCPSGSEIQVAVEDRGMGISPKELRKIFEPFYRAQTVREGQFRGVGLGLFLVKQMMESMQGSITVSSEIGRGTRFVLHFPVPSPAAGSSA